MSEVLSLPLITLDELLAADVEAPLGDVASVNEHVIRQAYWTAFLQTPEDDSTKPVFDLMQALTSMYLKTENRADVWVSQRAHAGLGSATPAVFRGEQNAVLAEFIDHVQHPALRARIADIVWTNDRKQGAVAAKAVDAYRACVTGLLEGTYKVEPEMPPRVVNDALFHLKRMLQILNITVKKAKRPEWMGETARAVYDRALAIKDYHTFANAAQTGLAFELFDEHAVAADAEALAASAPEEDYPDAVRRTWDLATRLHEKFGDRDAVNRCRIGAYRCTLAMRRFVIGSAGAEASWVMNALQELRHIQGLEQEEVALEVELRKLQKASLKQMGGIPIKLDLKDDQAATTKIFEDTPLEQSLQNLALLAAPIPPEELRKGAIGLVKNAPLMAMMGVSHIDADGRTAIKTPGASVGLEEPDEGWFDAMIDQSEGLRRMQMVGGRIETARVLIQSANGIEERHLAPIVGYSPFVPEDQKFNLVLGFVRFFQGDMISAAHLVIPKLEPCLRHVLKINGHDPSKRRDDGTEEDLSLSRIFETHREQLIEIFGLAATEEIERLFNRRPGPALRHEFAHGQVSAGQCFGHHVIYAVWLMYRLTCLFLIPHWQTVEEAIRRA